jgi:alpha-tubulin suppressor-like RCC1 family protein
MWISGNNGNGTLGLNDAVNRSSPIQVPGTQWTHIDNGNTAFSSLAIKSDSTLWAWGYGTQGQLGQNDTVEYSSPRQIPGTQWTGDGTTSRPSDAGGSHRFATVTKSDGTLWTWGENDNYGQLGQNDAVPRSSPTQVPGTQWDVALADRFNVYAKKTDGTLWIWGQGNWGAMGNNTAGISYSSPRQIPGTQWSDIGSTNYGPLVTKTDGTLWAWGYNGSGQLCTNDALPRSSPHQIPGTQWNYARPHGYYGFAALKTDGTLWMAGNNGNGALGQNDAVPRSSPHQIPGTQWSLTNGGYGNQGAIKTDGTLWVWGQNTTGRLGLNDAVPRSSPHQIPGTQWIDVAGSEAVGVFLKSS